jgi:hypothetical protein
MCIHAYYQELEQCQQGATADIVEMINTMNQWRKNPSLLLELPRMAINILQLLDKLPIYTFAKHLTQGQDPKSPPAQLRQVTYIFSSTAQFSNTSETKYQNTIRHS